MRVSIKVFKITVFLLLGSNLACSQIQNQKPPYKVKTALLVGANRTEKYIPALIGKKVAVVANHTTVIFKDTTHKHFIHLVDSLLGINIAITKVFSPEHGFRGDADAGEKVASNIDSKTGLPIISLYGKDRKPSQEHLSDVEVILFDIQDVGVRFYTYIATLQLVMQAAAEKGIPIWVLDRPNPNGHYVDGPTMEGAHTSFLGMNEIPLVYGMTIGEYATMINEEGWLGKGLKAKLTVIPLSGYHHDMIYDLPIRPSPNLPNSVAINLYPSLALFEGTNVNAGRGTEFQFQRFGASFLDSTHFDFSYVPQPNFGSQTPKEQGLPCYGRDLSKVNKLSEVNLEWLIDAYNHCKDKTQFFKTEGFTKHAGTQKLQNQIESGVTVSDIKLSWKADLETFKKIRAKYLIYP